MARMIKKVFDNLGFAWVNDTDHVVLTSAGKAFLDSDNPYQIIEQQLWKYQFWNPLIDSEDHKAIKLWPHAFLIQTLLNIPEGISSEEYILFVSRAQKTNDIDVVVERINNWRRLEKEKKNAIINELEHSIIQPGSRRKSIYNTIKLNCSYALAFLQLAHYLVDSNKDSNSKYSVCLKPSCRYEVEDRIKNFNKNSVYINFH